MSSASRPRSLRWHLLVLTLGTLLPLVLFGVTATVLATMHERDAFQRGARERTRALLTAVDAELTGHVSSLNQLGKSLALEAGQVEEFYEEVLRTIPAQPFWRGVSLALPSGKRILDSEPELLVEQPDIRERDSFEHALASRLPVVGALFDYSGAKRFSVRVPVVYGDETRYVLSAIVDPQCILSMLREQRLPDDWVLVVLDAEERIVARTRNHESLFGSYAAPSLRDALGRGSEGWFHGTTLEGVEVYTPFSRSPTTDWSVAFGIPAAYVEAGAARALWILGIGVIAAVLLAVVLASALGRRISEPIAALVTLAKEVGRGTPIEMPESQEVQEVNDVGRALVTSAEKVRQREEALRGADRAKDEFLAMLGHELRNPLSAISAAAQVLQLVAPEEGPSKESAAIVARQVQHMTRLVDDLLDVSRVTTGKIALARKPIELGQLVRNTLDTLRQSDRLNEHELGVETSSVWIEADEARVEQIVSNLVGNAVKYTPAPGWIRVRVARDGDEAVLEVADGGVGLPPELLERVFDLFVQGERGLDRRLGGLGIGLTLVRRLAELHGGSVHAASDGVGRGSCFRVRLPAIEPPPARAPRSVPGEPSGERRRVLVVEDNDDARRTLCAALELAGFEVHAAADGPAGLAAANALHPEAAVIDIGLPGIDGYELARTIRSTERGAQVLLVALTGYGQAESRRRALEAGFDVYLTKPVTPDSLARIIARGHAARSGGTSA